MDIPLKCLIINNIYFASDDKLMSFFIVLTDYLSRSFCHSFDYSCRQL